MSSFLLLNCDHILFQEEPHHTDITSITKRLRQIETDLEKAKWEKIRTQLRYYWRRIVDSNADAEKIKEIEERLMDVSRRVAYLDDLEKATQEGLTALQEWSEAWSTLERLQDFRQQFLAKHGNEEPLPGWWKRDLAKARYIQLQRKEITRVKLDKFNKLYKER